MRRTLVLLGITAGAVLNVGATGISCTLDSAAQSCYQQNQVPYDETVNWLTGLGEAYGGPHSGAWSTSNQAINVPLTSPATLQRSFAGQIVILHADESQTVKESVTAPPNNTGYMPTPISFANPTDQIFLQLYGTGLIHAGTVTATINRKSVPVTYAGAEGIGTGLDQVNLQVPSSLAGSGTVNIVITADGQAANTVTTLIQ